MISIAVITAPRPKPSLYDSLCSLRKAGFYQQVLVLSDDPAPPLRLDGVVTLINEVKLGNKRNWTRALALLVEEIDRDDGWVMILEDDIAWAEGAAAVLEADLSRLIRQKELMNLAGVFSLYAPRRMTKLAKRRLPEGWHYKNMQIGRKLWGAQALVLTRKMGRALLGNSTFRSYYNNERMDKNIDLIIGHAVQEMGKNVVYRIPCLVDHVYGKSNSSLGYEERWELETDYFKGPIAS